MACGIFFSVTACKLWAVAWGSSPPNRDWSLASGAQSLSQWTSSKVPTTDSDFKTPSWHWRIGQCGQKTHTFAIRSVKLKSWKQQLTWRNIAKRETPRLWRENPSSLTALSSLRLSENPWVTWSPFSLAWLVTLEVLHSWREVLVTRVLLRKVTLEGCLPPRVVWTSLRWLVPPSALDCDYSHSPGPLVVCLGSPVILGIYFYFHTVDFKKAAQCESCEWSFIWGNEQQHLRQLWETVSKMQGEGTVCMWFW